MPYLFTSESVSEGHPDKVADQISDALVDHFIAFDPQSKVACETLVTTGQVVLAGEVKSNVYLDVQQIARDVIQRICACVPGCVCSVRRRHVRELSHHRRYDLCLSRHRAMLFCF